MLKVDNLSATSGSHRERGAFSLTYKYYHSHTPSFIHRHTYVDTHTLENLKPGILMSANSHSYCEIYS